LHTSERSRGLRDLQGLDLGRIPIRSTLRARDCANTFKNHQSYVYALLLMAQFLEASRKVNSSPNTPKGHAERSKVLARQSVLRTLEIHTAASILTRAGPATRCSGVCGVAEFGKRAKTPMGRLREALTKRASKRFLRG
jgi:hypothetical protein